MRAGGGRAAAEVVHVGMDARTGGASPPGIAPGGSLLLVPGRRLLPLDLGGEAGAVRAGEGVGLEPGDVDDGLLRVQRVEPPEAPLGAEVRRPASGLVMSYSSFQAQPSSDHHSRRS